MRPICLLAPVSLLIGMLAAAPPQYLKQVAKFRADREKSLRSADGWTTLVELRWLKPGENRVGSDPKLGTLILKNGRVEYRSAAGVTTRAKDEEQFLAAGTRTYFLIHRADRFGIRVKDSNALARKQFTHLNWYPVDPSWRIAARFTPYAKPRKVSFDTVIAGLQEQDEAPGFVTFSRGGHEYRLDPVLDENELFFIFRDQTSGKTTYGASRFLYADAPRSLKTPGTVILDFNEAINPPCVFTPYATCPLAPPQNRLALPVTAGELMYNSHR
ncbi:MAG TPA: DUF1684 domain-containing protein [Bryobacteraceae bacterium]|nr:DUF1684 domain-containing protein [Bryobacteraceae bacterium]